MRQDEEDAKMEEEHGDSMTYINMHQMARYINANTHNLHKPYIHRHASNVND